MMSLYVKRIHEKAKLPEKKRDSDEGFDVFSLNTVMLPPNSVTKIPTGVIAYIEDVSTASYWIQIEGRSGLASKGIFPVGGIVDSSYRGEIIVILANITPSGLIINEGDKIAQLIPRTHYNPIVEEIWDITETDRGNKGFGSSGS